jgi:hypothetical protein
MRADVKFRKPQADPSDCKRAICNAIPIYLSFANREYPGVQTSDGWHGGCQCREAESEAKLRSVGIRGRQRVKQRFYSNGIAA